MSHRQKTNHAEQVHLDDLWTSHGRLRTEPGARANKDRPPSIYVNSQGYQYVSARYNGDRAWAAIHQLTELAKDREPECDPETCPCSRRGPCPYRVFSDGRYHVHHKHAVPDDSELGYLLRRFNYPDNLELMDNEDHGHETKDHVYGEDGGGP